MRGTASNTRRTIPLSSKILVTGGHGFLGSHLIEHLYSQGYTNIISPKSSEFDLTNQNATRELFRLKNPDLVFHLAARVGGIHANELHPGQFFRDNMIMGINVLDEAKRNNTKVVIAGTVCSYPRETAIPFQEDNLWNGYPEETNAPYGVAKKALLVMAQAYRKEFGCNFVMLFPANMYGPRDNFDLDTSHVIPAIIRKMVEAKDKKKKFVNLWGNGLPTREFLYVKDCAEALFLAAELYNEGEPVNVGVGSEISIYNLAMKISELTEFDGAIVWETTKPCGQMRRTLNVTRAKEKFGFTAKTPLFEGLKETIEWYQKQYAARTYDTTQ